VNTILLNVYFQSEKSLDIDHMLFPVLLSGIGSPEVKFRDGKIGRLHCGAALVHCQCGTYPKSAQLPQRA